jgi:hypothetical protein
MKSLIFDEYGRMGEKSKIYETQTILIYQTMDVLKRLWVLSQKIAP